MLRQKSKSKSRFNSPLNPPINNGIGCISITREVTIMTEVTPAAAEVGGIQKWAAVAPANDKLNIERNLPGSSYAGKDSAGPPGADTPSHQKSLATVDNTSTLPSLKKNVCFTSPFSESMISGAASAGARIHIHFQRAFDNKGQELKFVEVHRDVRNKPKLTIGMLLRYKDRDGTCADLRIIKLGEWSTGWHYMIWIQVQSPDPRFKIRNVIRCWVKAEHSDIGKLTSAEKELLWKHRWRLRKHYFDTKAYHRALGKVFIEDMHIDYVSPDNLVHIGTVLELTKPMQPVLDISPSSLISLMSD